MYLQKQNLAAPFLLLNCAILYYVPSVANKHLIYNNHKHKLLTNNGHVHQRLINVLQCLLVTLFDVIHCPAFPDRRYPLACAHQSQSFLQSEC